MPPVLTVEFLTIRLHILRPNHKFLTQKLPQLLLYGWRIRTPLIFPSAVYAPFIMPRIDDLVEALALQQPLLRLGPNIAPMLLYTGCASRGRSFRPF